MFIRITKHLPGCPRATDKWYNANFDECDHCEQVVESVPIKDALRHISQLIGKDVDEDELTNYVRRGNAPHN